MYNEGGTNMTNVIYQLETLTCPTCAAKIESMLKKTEGIRFAEVAFVSSKVKLSFEENIIGADEIKTRIAKFGYHVLSEK